MDDRRRLQHHLDPLVRDAEQEVRLDQLEPLVRERRRVDGDLRPHAPRRMRERLLRRDAVSSSRVRPRNGPPEPVSTSESTCSDARPSRHWKSAECSLSTGRMRPPPRSLRLERKLAGGDEALLVREREVDAVLERPERRVNPGEADDGVEDDVRLAPSSSSVRSPPTCLSGASMPSSGDEPEAAAHSSSSGCASTISIACRPIEPVAPRRATRFTRGQCRWTVSRAEAEHEVVRGRRRRRGARRRGRGPRRAPRGAWPVSFTCMSRLTRLEQVADDRGEHDDERRARRDCHTLDTCAACRRARRTRRRLRRARRATSPSHVFPGDSVGASL